ncbi:MAG: DNA translocase FtsK 4TM domain-containing protein [Bacteroidales bacterium]|nr:DNA translocase FtsK 4TM domain-containing protein [Bacteroidales bacterium]
MATKAKGKPAVSKSSGKNKKPVKKKKASVKRPRLTDEQKSIVRIVMGVLFAIICLFTAASLISYAFNWGADQSLKSNPDLWQSYVSANNVCGKIGFKWADFLFAKLFGIGAFFVPVFLGLLAVACFRIRKVRVVRAFVLSLFGCIIFSIIAAYISSFFNGQALFSTGVGGSYGNLSNTWLCSMIGKLGAGGVLLFLLFVWLILLTRKVALWFDKFIYGAFHREKKPVETPEEEEDDEMDDEEDEDIDDEDLFKDDDEEEDSEGEDEDETEVEEAAVPLEVEDDSPINADDFFVSPDDTPVADAPAEDAPAEDKTEPKPDAGQDVELVVEADENDIFKNLSEEEKDRIYDPRLDLSNYTFPGLNLLEDYRNLQYEVSREELEKNKVRIVNSLSCYKIKVESVVAKRGPTVTLYRIRLAEGIRIATVKRLEEDIAMSLGAKGVRVLTLSDAIGIEVANEHPSVVPLKAVLNSPQFIEQREKMELPVALGITVTSEPFFMDLAKMPHLLVAGATGTGKSVGLNAIITSLLFTKHPSELKFVMVDPKKVELDFYRLLEKHYLAKLPDEDEAIITDTNKVVRTLKSLCIEMDNRYELLRIAGERKITEYNEKFLRRKLNPLKGHAYMPYIVVVIDEFADLLMTAGREVEEPIARLAQKARAVGIHLVIATQRPTTDVITGTIKANFISRIAFKTYSSVDSKTILDQPGANRLIGRGDMLVAYPGIDITRVQCALIETAEVDRITKFIDSQQGYDHAFFLPDVDDEEGEATGGADLHKRDKLFEEAAKLVVQSQQGSTSLLQRKLGIGYNKAGRLIDQLEAAGIVGPFSGSKARTVLVTDFDTLDRILERLDNL